MSSSTLLRAIGVVEFLMGLSGVRSVGVVLLSHQALGVWGCIGLLVLFSLALVSLWAGSLLVQARRRGIVPSLWLFVSQTVQISLPGFTWIVPLTWSVNVVLYLHPSDEHIGNLVVVLGHSSLPDLLSVNVLAALPLAVLFVIWSRGRTKPLAQPAREA